MIALIIVGFMFVYLMLGIVVDSIKGGRDEVDGFVVSFWPFVALWITASFAANSVLEFFRGKEEPFDGEGMKGIREILDGIDREDVQDGGWWPSDTGVKFGIKKRQQIEQHIEDVVRSYYRKQPLVSRHILERFREGIV